MGFILGRMFCLAGGVLGITLCLFLGAEEPPANESTPSRANLVDPNLVDPNLVDLIPQFGEGAVVAALLTSDLPVVTGLPNGSEPWEPDLDLQADARTCEIAAYLLALVVHLESVDAETFRGRLHAPARYRLRRLAVVHHTSKWSRADPVAETGPPLSNQWPDHVVADARVLQRVQRENPEWSRVFWKSLNAWVE